MKILFTIVSAALVFCLSPAAGAEDEFGRFFTTPKQRQNLNELRVKQPNEDLIVELTGDEMLDEEAPIEKQAPVDVVRLKGLVYRHGGKSTAWLNDGNTFEGDIGSQYINIDGIESESVTLDIAGDKSKVRLKAGQAYEPATKKIHDVITK